MQKEKLLNLALLVSSALILVVLLLGSFWIGDRYHIGFVQLFLGWMSLVFVATIGWDLRNKFRRASFILFFLVWLGVHLLVLVLVVGRTAWFYWLPLLGLELWVGYGVAFRVFGPPASRRSNRINNPD